MTLRVINIYFLMFFISYSDLGVSARWEATLDISNNCFIFQIPSSKTKIKPFCDEIYCWNFTCYFPIYLAMFPQVFAVKYQKSLFKPLYFFFISASDLGVSVSGWEGTLIIANIWDCEFCRLRKNPMEEVKSNEKKNELKK